MQRGWQTRAEFEGEDVLVRVRRGGMMAASTLKSLVASAEGLVDESEA